MVRPTGYAAAAVLAGIGALHAAWGTGSSFPFRTHAELSDTVAGTPAVPPPAACYSVAGALAVAAGLAADLPVGPRRLRVIGRIGVAVALGVRGLLGLLGRVELVSPGSNSPRFRRFDRRVYTPLCLLLSAAVASAVRGARLRG
jgi:hypothetical protein